MHHARLQTQLTNIIKYPQVVSSVCDRGLSKAVDSAAADRSRSARGEIIPSKVGAAADGSLHLTLKIVPVLDQSNCRLLIQRVIRVRILQHHETHLFRKTHDDAVNNIQ